MSSPRSSLRASFTDKQGQYLAFIDAYTRVNGRPPAEADLQRHFRVSPPSVHQMVLTLERAELIRRQPGLARRQVVEQGRQRESVAPISTDAREGPRSLAS